jgi:hypothetical protein
MEGVSLCAPTWRALVTAAETERVVSSIPRPEAARVAVVTAILLLPVCAERSDGGEELFHRGGEAGLLVLERVGGEIEDILVDGELSHATLAPQTGEAV